ncbi:hypothetical protein X738_31510 [Mesorhizobium sp. LNHC209A00]|nr:hypothetical protein X738_31510 [Mesorhizobium sp. LNHC209A00]
MLRICVVLGLGAGLFGCANRELKAPCGPLAYAHADECGALKPVNSTPFASIIDEDP